MAGKYLSGSGLGYLWNQIKSTFLIEPEEIETPSIINRKFATFSEMGPHICGNSESGMTSSSRILVPLQVSPDFDGSTGCYVYLSYVASGQLNHRALYQVSGGRLYTTPDSGTPQLVTSIANIDGGLSSTGGFYVKQDSVHGNWWLSNTNDTINSESFGITYSSGTNPDPEDPPIVTPSYGSTIYITGTTLDTTHLSDTMSDWWASDDATAFVRYRAAFDFDEFYFTQPVTNNGGTRLCLGVSDGSRMWDYTITKTSSSPYYSITRSQSNYQQPTL